MSYCMTRTPEQVHPADITITTGATWGHYVRDDCGYSGEAPGILPWVMPVGEGDYPPERWYCATWHDLTGVRNGGYKHTGLDLNLDVAPWGDVERSLDLGVYAVADGAVTYYTPNWSGVPMVVIRHEHEGAPLWVRYAHVKPQYPILEGLVVSAGDMLGGFANWPERGDHLHFDMALDEFTREWLDPRIRWVDPVPVLNAHHDPAIVGAMLRKGE
jgi:hypothetical protein